MSFTDLDVKTIGALATGTLAPSFDFDGNDQLEVWLRDESVAASPTETLQTLTTHYTLTGDPATNVTMVTTPSANQRMILKRTTALTQELSILDTQNFPNSSVESQFDRVTHMVAELAEKLKRSLKFQIGTSASDDRSLPEPVTGKYLAWDANGNITNQSETDPTTITTTTWSESLLDDTTAAAGRATLGLDGTGGVLAPGDMDVDARTWPSRGDAENLQLLGSNGLVVNGADGNDLSATNPGFITIKHTTDNHKYLRLKVTERKFFLDGSVTSDIIGEEFGVTTGVAWGEQRPFYIYAVNGDNTDSGVEFAISPDPTAKRAPGLLNTGYKGNPATNNEDVNFFYLTSTDPSLTHPNKSCTLIGGFTMTMDASDDWTVGSLGGTVYKDGIRPDPFVGDIFSMPFGQNGAAASSHLKSAGTVPTWASGSTSHYKYHIGLDGMVRVNFNTTGAGNCTNGVGGQVVEIAQPYTIYSSENLNYPQGIARRGGTAAPIVIEAYGSVNSSELQTTALAAVVNTSFSNAADDIMLTYSFKAFESY